jgi:hypothetical protein
MEAAAMLEVETIAASHGEAQAQLHDRNAFVNYFQQQRTAFCLFSLFHSSLLRRSHIN